MFEPRAHPERCTEEWEPRTGPDYHAALLRRLSLLVALTGVVVLQLGLLVGGGFLLVRWLRIACWLTGCPR